MVYAIYKVQNSGSVMILCESCASDVPSPSVAKHLPQTLLLVGSQYCGGFEVDVDVRIDGIVAEVVLC